MNTAKPAWLSNILDFENDDNLQLSFTASPNEATEHLSELRVIWQGETQKQDELKLNMTFHEKGFTCEWKPHLTPEHDMVIGDLFYYSPALIFRKKDRLFSLIPNLNWIKQNRTVQQYCDYVLDDGGVLSYGLGSYEKTRHVYHRLTHEPFQVNKGQTLFSFYLIEWQQQPKIHDFTPVVNFIWQAFGEANFKKQKIKTLGDLGELTKYAHYTYSWALDSWRTIDWQEFDYDHKRVGGWVFLARAGQKPGMGEENVWRERKSVWNQAWFSSLRSAVGAALWSRQWHSQDMWRAASLAKELALSAPQVNGFFPSVFDAGENGDWSTGSWTNSDRCPEGLQSYNHLLDMSWTCHWMLRWYQEVEQDSRLLEYAERYAERLIQLQAAEGSFPAWINNETGDVSEYLADGPETSMQAWFLAELFMVNGDQRYLDSAKRAIAFVETKVVPEGRWEDFETYWSCSALWAGKVYHQREPRSGLYSQCNFSIYWTAEAYKQLYLATENKDYLKNGTTLLAELSLYQAVWNPQYMNVPTLGGFTVMNTDDEWNDARQSLFAETYYDYYRLTNNQQWLDRSLIAMKASYYMMYCPENAETSRLYQKTFPFFESTEYGFEMENAGHADNIDKTGEFTGFDWGNGSASTSLVNLLIKSGQLADISID